MAAVAAPNAARQLPLQLRNAALAAGGIVALAGRGDMWTLAVAFGVADASAITALVVALGAVAAIARTGSAGLSDLAGAQAVLGAAGFTGSAAAVGSAWLSAASVILVARDRWTGLALGALGGLLIAGPSPNADAGWALLWVAAAVGGAAVGWVVAPDERRLRWQPWVAVVLGAGALSLGVVAGYR